MDSYEVKRVDTDYFVQWGCGDSGRTPPLLVLVKTSSKAVSFTLAYFGEYNSILLYKI